MSEQTEGVPEQTDNSPRPEDGDQSDLNQEPGSVNEPESTEVEVDVTVTPGGGSGGSSDSAE